MSAGKQRNANLDLLRILAMLLIILLHSIDHSGVLEAAPAAGTAAAFYVRFLYMLTQVCVNCYVMLSGYFLVTSAFRLQKLAALWLETVFYSLVIKLIFMLSGESAFSPLALLSCLFPFVTGRYWFITIYVGLYLLSPFLNLAIRAMDRRQHAVLNLLLMLLFSAWNSLHPSIKGMNSGGAWGLAWFAVLYFSAAWFRLYAGEERKGWRRTALLWPLLSLLTAALYCFVGGRIALVQRIVGNWYRYDSLPAYFATIALFAAFLRVRVRGEKTAKAISRIAPATLGVYLIHAHANLSPWLWEKLALPGFLGKWYFPLLQLLAVLLIYAVCTALDLLRARTVGQIERSKFICSLCDKTEKKFLLLQEKYL